MKLSLRLSTATVKRSGVDNETEGEEVEAPV
jgi:hypothetical protein